MTLSNQAIEGVLRMIAGTRGNEIDCDECLDGMSAFAEAQLAGRPVDEARLAIEQHLTLCPECRQEFQTLLDAVRALDEG